MKILIALITLFMWSSLAHAGFVITTEQNADGGKQKLIEKMYLNPDRMRVEVLDGSHTQWMIYRDDLKKVWVSEGSEYMELSQASLQQLKSQVSQLSETMKEQLSQLPPDQREMIEKTMKQMTGEEPPAPENKVKFVKEKSAVPVDSWTTDYYVGYTNGKKTDEVWTVGKKDFPIEEGSMAIIQKFVTMMSLAAKDVFGLFDANMSQDKNGFQGWPVQLVQYGCSMMKPEKSVTA
jgi:hypothetical protein